MSMKSMGIANALLASAQEAAKQAGDTLGGIGMVCFTTEAEQDAAISKGRAKLALAHKIVADCETFKSQYGDFS